MRFLLDTNVCIALINARVLPIRERFDREISQASDIYVSSLVVFELGYGAAKSRRREFNAQLLAGFLSGPVRHLAFDDQDARIAGELRAELEFAGRPVGPYDLLIAGQALRHQMTLVTANLKEFGRVKNLSWEDWSRA